ncbi:LPS export ABC transporter permease LptF [Dokdonella koreensis]|uniref:Lipopolysaccharide export system permease protein LptF n=1 Tax=Dokdonella koreensis DS-123 TaxID=1300342 RepID=A0A167H6S4_9GAMM|nr:LPS export ABC transporter permease LptF [Dokdonella koreensis]ANB19206.1 Putative permease [Dokdonella koreensis DS-123]
MLRIIDRYLLRELAQSFAAVSVILLLITVGSTVADLLNRVARGRAPADLLFVLIGLRTVDGLTVLLPLAIFLGVLMAYGRLWRDSEMAVLSASGLDLRGLVRPLLLLAGPAMLVLGLVSFWLAPASVRLADRLLDDANRSMIVAGLEPGKFVSLPGTDGVIYVAGMSEDGRRFQRLFVATERGDEDDGQRRIDIITAPSGEMYHDADGEGRYLALMDGFRVEGRVGADDYRLMRFARNDVKLPSGEADQGSDKSKRSAPTAQLWSSDDLVQRVELHWRLASPLSALVLTLLALPLARSNPREPRYARLLIAVLCYFIYANAIVLGRAWMVAGKLSTAVGYWWIYLATIAIAGVLVWRGQQLRRPRAVRGAA